MRNRILKTIELYESNASIAASFVFNFEYPWEILPHIGEVIMRIGATLPENKFEIWENNVWVSKSAKVAKSVSLTGPCIIDENAEVRQCAFVRGNVLIGKKTVVGNSTELKNCILFDEVQVPHYNYVGDSVLGFRTHMGAGSITSNVKSDKGPVSIKNGDECVQTGLKKCGAFLGDFVEVGCGAILNPGTVIGNNSMIYPLSSVRGIIDKNCIYKSGESIIEKT